MGLKNYQKKALQKGRQGGLLPPSFDALTSGENEHILILLKAITGSGKTVIASEYIERILTAEPEDRGSAPICVIWLSKGNGMLHMQSSDKIKGYIKSSSVHVTGLEKSSDFSAPRFYDNDVYVINWEKLYSDNNLVTETEDENLLSALRNTPCDMRFIMIVDEFHAGYEQETYNRMAELIKPVIILGMTATPKVEQLARADKKIVIPVKDIQDEAMVKLGIKFNAQTDIPPIESYDTQEEYFLKLALKRRDMLEETYRKEGVDIVPLLLIQFDDERSGKEVSAAVSSITALLDEIYSHNVNGDYAVWMDVKKNSPIKRSDDNIIRNLDINKVKVLLFKQAIAIGWDCPRAQVILRYRKINDSGDGAFDLQTLGRIFRMPQPDRGSYYDNPSLNYGYVYSVDNTYKLEKSFGESLTEGGDEDSFANTIDYLQKKKFKTAVNELEELLKSENNTVETRKADDDSLCDETERLISGLPWLRSLSAASEALTYQESTVNIADEMKLEKDGTFQVQRTGKIREREVEKLFSDVIPASCSYTVKDQIITGIRRELNGSCTPDQRNRLILANRDVIGQLMKALDDYNKKHAHRFKAANRDFQFPEYVSIPDGKNIGSPRSLYGVSSGNYSNPEKIFIAKLEDNPNVLFWFKNKDSGQNAFCVAYAVHSQTEPTYPDFIVAFTDGTFGFYEIKDADDRTPEIPLKKDGIEKRIRELNRKAPGRFHGTLLRVNIKNEVVIDMESYPEFS